MKTSEEDGAKAGKWSMEGVEKCNGKRIMRSIGSSEIQEETDGLMNKKEMGGGSNGGGMISRTKALKKTPHTKKKKKKGGVQSGKRFKQNFLMKITNACTGRISIGGRGKKG